MVSPTLFKSSNPDWETPQWLFDELDQEFRFTCDVAADILNAKCANYIDAAWDALTVPWSAVNWCNPPYGREVWRWVFKAHLEALGGNTTVMLLPARTDTAWFHAYIYGHYEIRFLRGRLTFVGAKSAAPFPSMIVVFRGGGEKDKNSVHLQPLPGK